MKRKQNKKAQIGKNLGNSLTDLLVLIRTNVL